MLNLGGVWDVLNRLVATFIRILTVFWTFQIIFFKASVQDELQEAFWMDFGSLWDGFGRVWGEIWKDLGPFRQVMGSEALLPSPKSNLHLQWYKTNF